jgi:hypothetical protein
MTPIVSSIAPTIGSTGGFAVVEIVGSNFRQPTTAAPSGSGITPPPAPSVIVNFGVVPARLVRVASSTRLVVTLPEHDEGTVDVEVLNVDDFGAVLGRAVVAGGFEFRRPKFTGESRLTTIVRALIRSLKRWIMPNVVYTQHVDFDDDPIDALRKVAETELPILFLTGPTLRENPFHREQVDPTAPPVTSDVDEGSVAEYRIPKTFDLVFGVTVAMDAAIPTLELLNAAIVSMNRAQRLTVDHGSPTGVVSYELAIEGNPEVQSRATRSSVYSASMTIAVIGVDIVDLPGFVGDMTTTLRPLVTSDPSLSSEVVST